MIRAFRSPDRHLRRYLRTGDPRALGQLFDATAQELLRAALYLCRHPADAEDLLQRTFLTVIQARLNYDPKLRAMPWLCGILGNHARKLHARRQRDAERLRELAADPEAAAVPDSMEHAELLAALTQLRQQLGEPYCEVLDLHLGRGLEAAEIAAALGRNRSTVRAQLLRGLAQLRQRLPSSYLAGLVGLAMLPLPARAANVAAVRDNVLEEAAASAPVPLEIALPAAFGPAMVALLLLTVLTGAAAWSASRHAPPAGSGELALVAVDPAAASQRVLGAEVSAALVREAVTIAAADGAQATHPDGQGTIVVRGIVLDEADRPLAGAPLWRFAELDWRTAEVLGHSGDDGRFHLDFVVGGYLGAWQPGRIPSYLRRPTATNTELTLRLCGPAGTLVGQVFGADGLALVGASLEAGGPGGIVASNSPHERQVSPPRRVAVTSADGRFRLDGLEPGRVACTVRADGHAPFTGEVLVESGRVVPWVVRLFTGAGIAGVVRDLDQRPVAGATVHVVQGELPPRTVYSDAAGRFVVDGLAPGLAQATAELWKAPGGRTVATAAFSLAVATTARWEPVLQLPRVVRGRVVDPAGAPLAGLRLCADRPADLAQPLWAETDDDGNFQLEVAETPMPALCIHRGEVPLARRPPLPIGDEPALITLLPPELPNGAIVGRILDAAGVPVVANLAVTNHAFATVWRVASEPATGLFAVRNLPAGAFTLIVEASGHGRRPVRVLDLGVGECRTLPDLVLAAAGRAEVALAGGANRERRVLKVAQEDGTVVGHAMVEGVAASFELPAGRYRVAVLVGDGAGSATALDVAEGVTTQCRLPVLKTARWSVPTRGLPALPQGRRIDVAIHDAAGALYDACELATGCAADPTIDLDLPPGDYQITIRTTDGRRAAGRFRFVHDSWTAGELHCR